jgi:hypothetical protein
LTGSAVPAAPARPAAGAPPGRRTLRLPALPKVDAAGALKKGVAAITAFDWRKMDWKKLKDEKVASTSFWKITIGLAAALVLVVGFLAVRRATASRPTVPENSALAQEVAESRRELDEGKKLFAAGRYPESLALFQKVLAKDPNSKPAKQYAQMAQTALAGSEQQAQKTAEAERVMQLAQAAFAEGNFEESQKRADEVLALDGGRVDAQKLREDASAKLAEADAAKKKQTRASVAAARKPTAAPARGRGEEPTAVPAAGAASGTQTLRLLFDSPISEGHVMVAVNDQILLRKPFSFTRKESIFKSVKGTGTVDVSIPVQTGALNVKVWLSGPDIPASTFATAATQMPSGGARVLRLDYGSGHLSAHIQ